MRSSKINCRSLQTFNQLESELRARSSSFSYSRKEHTFDEMLRVRLRVVVQQAKYLNSVFLSPFRVYGVFLYDFV